jgi:uncharacterized protein YndB with AHSA1/START domain
VPEIAHEINVSASPEKVFDALSTLDGVKGWQTPTATGTGEVGSEWVFTFADHPEFAWQVVTSDSPTHVAWTCTRGPGDSVGTTVAFAVAPTPDGRTVVELTHAGWPGTHGNFRKCNTTWGVLLHHLRDYVESGTAATAFE